MRRKRRSTSGSKAPEVSLWNDKEKEEIRQLAAVRKMNKGWFDDLTITDMIALFRKLDADQSGRLDFKEISGLLKEVMDPPCSDNDVELLWSFTDQNDDGTVTAEELHDALYAGPIKAHMRRVQKDAKMRRDFATNSGLAVNVDRELLHSHIQAQVSQDDAFATLPYSMVNIGVLLMLVVQHLAIKDRRNAAEAVEQWVLEYGGTLSGPFLEDHVANSNTYFAWLHESGLPSLFSDCHNVSTGSGMTENCFLANRDILVADVKIHQWLYGASEPEPHVWLLHSDIAKEHLARQPGDYLTAARASIQQLRDTGFGGHGVQEIHLEFSTYTPVKGLFVMTDVATTLDRFGGVKPRVGSTSAVVQPYDSWGIWVWDVLYLILIAYVFFQEARDMINQVRHTGVMEGMKDYWNIYNVVDWASIVMAFTCMIIWLFVVQATQVENIQMVVARSDGYSVDGIMELGEQTDPVALLDEINDQLQWVRDLFFYLQVVMAGNVIAIIFRFFKAFEANPRLQLVTRTLSNAWIDIAHFAMVFLAVFLTFGTLGHVWFGQDLMEFESIERSCNTAFVVLMGDFEWYLQRNISDSPLPSNVPHALVVLWFWLFNCLVVLLMMNMLLAIVLEHYVEVLQGLSSSGSTVWSQTTEYLKRRKTFRNGGWMPLEKMLMMLEYDQDPAHPHQKVTQASIVKAFSEVPEEQAKWLFDRLQRECTERMTMNNADVELAMLKEIEGLVEMHGDDQKMTTLDAASSSKNSEAVKLPNWAMDDSAKEEDDPYELGMKALEPVQLQKQQEALIAISTVIDDLTARLDAVAPRMQPMAAVVNDLSLDVDEIKNSLRELQLPAMPSSSDQRQARQRQAGEEIQPPPQLRNRGGGKVLGGCLSNWR